MNISSILTHFLFSFSGFCVNRHNNYVPRHNSSLVFHHIIDGKRRIVVEFCGIDKDVYVVRIYGNGYDCIRKTKGFYHIFQNEFLFHSGYADHAKVIIDQRKRLGTKKGFIAVKSNCSLQSYVPALYPLDCFGIKQGLVCTYQAISGAGKTFERWPEMVDNVIPFIGGEEEKSEQEPLKIWGKVENGVIVNSETPKLTAQCLRVPVSDGHMAAVFVSFDKKPTREEILEKWQSFAGRAQELELPSAPKQFLHYFTEDNMPQTKLHRNLENGMAVSIGRLREDSQYDYKFVCLSHNTLRGAAGGAVLLAELLCAEGYID